MQKYIFFILIIFINLTAYAKENNSTVSAGAQGYINNLMLDKELTGRSGIVVEKGTITYTDSYGNKVTKEIKIPDEKDYIEIENNEEYIRGNNYGKYLTYTGYAGEYYEFLQADSVTVDDAKLIIAYAAGEVEKQSKPNAILDINKMGYFYDENSDDPFSCSDDFITGNLYKKYNFIDLMEAIADKNYYAWRNRALKKATDTIIKVSEKNMELSNSDKFFLILAEYAGGGLYNLKNMQKEMQKLINAGVNQQTILSYLMPYGICDFNENKCNAISSLMYELPNLTYNVEEAFRKLQAKYLVEYAAFINGYFNFFNDGIYNTVQVSRFNEYSILSVFDSSYVSEDYYYLYPRFYKELYGENKKSSSLEYTPLHCTDNVYFGNLYIFPYDNTTYIINTTKYENKILKIEVRSPKLFNTGYDNHYSIEPLIRTNSKSKVIENLSLYRVSSMDTFSYKDNMIYSQEFSRNIFADILGDIEREYDIRGEKISPDKMKKLFNISKFAVKNYEKSVIDYIKYLQKYINHKLIYNELYFYNIKSSNNFNIIVAAAYFYNQYGIKKEALFLVDNKNLNILNENEAKKINDIVSSEEFVDTIIYRVNNTINIGYVRNDNNVYLVQIDDKNKLYGQIYPPYNYSNIKENVNNISPDNNYSDDLIKLAGMDCTNVKNENDDLICSFRPLMTAKAYAELLYKKKLEKAEKYYYPKNIKKYIEILYKDMNNQYLKCERSFQCIMDTFIEYSTMFEYL